ncbi:MAG: hypothetical protein R3301_18135 [Saprospiraceae bacterium]|nr:hypothetical protein [Saprospiraceae bacterium]
MPRYQVTHPGFYVLSLVSLAILLVLIGFFISALFFSQQYTREFKEDIALVLELGPGFDRERSDDVVQFVTEYEGVLPESVAFITREEAMQEMIEELGESSMTAELQNPFFDMVEFSLAEDHLNATHVSQMETDAGESFGDVRIHHPADFFGDVFSLLHKLRIYVFAFIAVALFLTGTLIHHIMRLNVVAQRHQIRTMELVGARTAFIVQPFIRRGVQLAFLAWLIALLISLTGWFALLGSDRFVQFTTAPATIIGMACMLLAAIVICTLSTWIAVARSTGRPLASQR